MVYPYSMTHLHVYRYLVDNDLVSQVKVLDKVLPVTAFMSEAHAAAFADDRVICKQANLSSP